MARGQKKKQVRKQFTFFQTVYKLHPPYKVLVDIDFIQECLTHKVFLRDELPRILQDEGTHPVITHCTTVELRDKGPDYGLANVMAKKFMRARCPHDRNNPVSSAQCIKDVFEKFKGYYVGAIQNYELRKTLRNVPGVPLLYVNPYHQIILEKVSEASKTGGIKLANESVVGLPQKEEETSESKPLKRKSGWIKGPNPLSVQKRKTGEEPEKKKRPRRKKKKTEDNVNSEETTATDDVADVEEQEE